MRLPSVTVLCYTYNHADYIRDCLTGILSQVGDYQLRLIVRDDCSLDGTREIVREFAEMNPSVVVPILEEVNRWPCLKPLVAVRPHVAGDYLAFCEGDDFWTDPNKLQLQVAALERDPGASSSFHQVLKRDCNTGQQAPIWSLEHGATLGKADLLHPRTVLPTSALVMRNYADLPFGYANLAPNFDGFLTAFLGTKGYARYEGSVAPSVHRIHDRGVRSAGSLVARDLDSLLSHYWIAEYLVSCGLPGEAAEHLGLAARITFMGELGRLTGHPLKRAWLQSLSRYGLSRAKEQTLRARSHFPGKR